MKAHIRSYHVRIAWQEVRRVGCYVARRSPKRGDRELGVHRVEVEDRLVQVLRPTPRRREKDDVGGEVLGHGKEVPDDELNPVGHALKARNGHAITEAEAGMVSTAEHGGRSAHTRTGGGTEKEADDRRLDKETTALLECCG